MMKRAVSSLETIELKNVCLYINGESWVLEGYWHWDLNCDAVFCSDVILSYPPDFNGTRGIIHPDDIQKVKTRLETIHTGRKLQMHFRLITTYGEVREISGEGIQLSDHPIAHFYSYEEDIQEKLANEKQWLDENEDLKANHEVFNFSEEINQVGSWHYNLSTNKLYYSNNIYRIYGLPPQSLNAHLNTFNPYIHPADRQAVEEAFETAFKQKLPLQLQYRIVLSDESEKYIRFSCRWTFNIKGERILNAIVQDITQGVKQEEEFAVIRKQAAYREKLLLFNEQTHGIGGWQINLQTRKIVYSENCYRIFGIKMQSAGEGINWFSKMVHPDDQARVEEMHQQMILEHKTPDIEYRIIKPNGRTTYIRQKGKALIYGDELVIAGTIEDVTAEKQLTTEINDSFRLLAINQFTLATTEKAIGVAHWLWQLDSGNITWSDNFYHLLGYKTNVVELSQKLLINFIHPDDRKIFTEFIAATLRDKTEQDFSFRLIRHGETRNMNALFRITEYEGESFFIAVFQDVTVQHLLRATAEDQNQFKHLLSDSLFDSLLVMDLNYRIIEWNKRCEETFGKSKNEVLFHNFFDIFPTLRIDSVFNDFRKVLNGEIIMMEHMPSFISKQIWNMYLTPLIDHKGGVIGIIQILRDVTKEFTLQKELAGRLQFIEKLLESSMDRIIVLNSNLNFLYWNKKAEEYTGLSKDQVIGKNILEVFPGTRQKQSYHEFRKALKGETVHIPFEQSLGERGYHESFIIPVKDDKNNVSAVLWVMHDITRDYQLQQQQAKANMILDTIDEAFYELDENQCFTYVNRKCEQLWNIPKEELLGKNMWQVFPGAIDSPAYFAIQFVMEEGTSVRSDFTSAIIHKPVSTTIIPSPTGVIVFFREIQVVG